MKRASIAALAGPRTALVMAGAQWCMLAVARHCGEHLDADVGFCSYGLAGKPAAQAMRRIQYLVAKAPDNLLPDSLKAGQDENLVYAVR